LIAGFSTLFAVQAPGLTATYVDEPQPIALLLRDFATTKFRIIPRPNSKAKHYITLDDANWKPTRRHPLPEHWQSNAVSRAGTRPTI
jgi:hypothetical protein